MGEETRVVVEVGCGHRSAFQSPNPVHRFTSFRIISHHLSCSVSFMPQRRTATPAVRDTTPATNTSSFTTPEATDSELENLNDPPAPAVINSPIRRRQRNAAPGIRSQSDLAVWDLTDEDIIGWFSHQEA